MLLRDPLQLLRDDVLGIPELSRARIRNSCQRASAVLVTIHTEGKKLRD